MHFVVADAATGVILYQAYTSAPWDVVLQVWIQPGQMAVQVPEWLADQTQWRVVDGEVVPIEGEPAEEPAE